MGQNKLACDWQANRLRNVEWARQHNVVGPFLNAVWSEDTGAGSSDSESDGETEDEVNCKVDRTSAWIDPETKLLCMLISSLKPIRKGQFLMWKYNPYAGPGRFWSFREKRAKAKKAGAEPVNAAAAALITAPDSPA